MNDQSAGGPREENKGINFDHIDASMEFRSDASVSDSDDKVSPCCAFIPLKKFLIIYSLARMKRF